MPYYKITSSINKGTSIFNSHFLHSYIKVGFKPYHHQFGCQEECKIAYFIVRVITCIQVCVCFIYSCTVKNFFVNLKHVDRIIKKNENSYFYIDVKNENPRGIFRV